MTPRQLLDLVCVDVCVCMFKWVCECVCKKLQHASWCTHACDYTHCGLSGCVTICKLILQTHWPLVLKDKSVKHIFTLKNSFVTLTLCLTPQGPWGPPGGWKVKSSANLEWVRMLATSSSTPTTSPACEICPHLTPFNTQCMCRRHLTAWAVLQVHCKINRPWMCIDSQTGSCPLLQ